MDNHFYVAAFKSRRQVFVLESQLRRAGYMVQAISTPRGISLGCGLSVMFQANAMAMVRAQVRALGAASHTFLGIYECQRRPDGSLQVTPMPG
ncbi:MAG: DUF3343 domain-containing protein [Christensenellales bacterium]|jgi:hypothetical protein